MPQFVEKMTPSNKNFGMDEDDVYVVFPSRVDGSSLKFMGDARLPISGTIPYPLIAE